MFGKKEVVHLLSGSVFTACAVLVLLLRVGPAVFQTALKNKKPYFITKSGSFVRAKSLLKILKKEKLGQRHKEREIDHKEAEEWGEFTWIETVEE